MRTWLVAALFAAFSMVFVAVSCNSAADRPESAVVRSPEADSMAMFPRVFEVDQLMGRIKIDGALDRAAWSMAEWLPLEQVWIGPKPDTADFQGRYKLAWGRDALYVLAEIKDNRLEDTHPDGLDRYWDDDCLEIFVDEDGSGGPHQFSHNAFAYHIALDGRVADFGTDSLPIYLNDHCRVARQTHRNISVWEVEVKVFDDKFDQKRKSNRPVRLAPGKKLGFALAYCDNDGSPERENFIGSVFVPGADKNRGYIDASIFGKLILK